MDAKTLRTKYPVFRFDGFKWKIEGNDMVASFKFIAQPEIAFEPYLIIKNVNVQRLALIGKENIDNLLFNLGMIEMLSYWKATCSPIIEIGIQSLSKDQVKWWKELIFNGLGEFFYSNKINFNEDDFLEIRAQNFPLKPYRGKLSEKNLVAVGGGKDSALTLEILSKSGQAYDCFVLNPMPASQAIISASHCAHIREVHRKIDPKLLELNNQGYLNGHTPFSAYLAFLSVLLGVVFDEKYLIFSNENSANEGNFTYLNRKINHQYSKTFDFEEKFRAYCKKYLAQNCEYFSFLRPLSELQIAHMFSASSVYPELFLSCNNAQKTQSGLKRPDFRWCAGCPKCLFVFIMLYPFMEKDRLVKIFGANLYEKTALKPTLNALLGFKSTKPLECVGTAKETLAALILALHKAKGRTPALLSYFSKTILPQAGLKKDEIIKIFNSWDRKNFLPASFAKILREYAKNEIKRIKK